MTNAIRGKLATEEDSAFVDVVEATQIMKKYKVDLGFEICDLPGKKSFDKYFQS